MAAGDVTAQIVDAVASDIDTAITAMRVTANDKWFMCSLNSRPGQVLIVHIEEA